MDPGRKRPRPRAPRSGAGGGGDESSLSLRLRIERLAAGGDGVGRAPDGRVVFVPFSAPGDRLDVRVVEERPRYLRGEIEALVEPGEARVAPRCEVFGECGGCAWQHLRIEAQLEAKQRILQDALERIGGLALDAPPPIRASPSAWGWRSRARVLVRGGRVGFRRRRSHEPCPTSHCPVLAPELDSLLAGLASRFAGEPGRSEEWELAAGEQGGRAAALGRGGAPAPGERIVIGVLGERIGVSPGVFAQGNASMHEALASRVVECAGEGTLCVELHAGAGFFTLPLARRFERLVAVESNAAAVADLRANLAAAGLERVRVVRRRVESAGRALARETPDVVVLDPPRSGLAPRAIEVVARLDAPRVVHLGCDPATFARDLRRLARHGYSPTFVEAFDLFPHTPHLEALALLEKAPNGQPGARDDVRADTRTPRG